MAIKMERIRLYFDATPLINKHISGIGKVLLETLRALDTEQYAKKYDIYVFVPFDEVGKLRRFPFSYIRIKSLPYPHKFHSLFSRMRLSPPIDLFLGKGIYVFENYRNWNLIRSKSITYIHDVAFKVHPEFVEQANLKYLNRYIDLWMSRTDRVVTVSQSSRNEIEQQLAVKDVAVVVNAADNDMYRRDNLEIEQVRNKWNIPSKYYIYFGNIEPRKNLVNTIKGFKSYIESSGSDAALVLIGGDGWRNEEIYAEIESARKTGVHIIKPTGYVPDEDIPALLSGAIALLQLSWHEGFGMSVLHALACGTPVLASDISALHEAAQNNEKNVIFVDPTSVKEIALGVDKVSSLPRQEPTNILRWSDSLASLERILDSL